MHLVHLNRQNRQIITTAKSIKWKGGGSPTTPTQCTTRFKINYLQKNRQILNK